MLWLLPVFVKTIIFSLKCNDPKCNDHEETKQPLITLGELVEKLVIILGFNNLMADPGLTRRQFLQRNALLVRSHRKDNKYSFNKVQVVPSGSSVTSNSI
jgi:hypothetical protein